MEKQHKLTRELATGIALGIGDRAEKMDVIFLIGAADSRELELVHGDQLRLVTVTATRVENLYRGGSPDGVLNTGPNETGPTEVGPAWATIIQMCADAGHKKTRMARVCRRLSFGVERPGCRFCCSVIKLARTWPLRQPVFSCRQMVTLLF